MSAFLKNITFHGILTDALVAEGNKEMIMTSKCLTDGIMSGVVKPLETSVFSTDQVEEAFRYMAQGKHVGKVLIKVLCGNCPLVHMLNTIKALASEMVTFSFILSTNLIKNIQV